MRSKIKSIDINLLLGAWDAKDDGWKKDIVAKHPDVPHLIEAARAFPNQQIGVNAYHLPVDDVTDKIRQAYHARVADWSRPSILSGEMTLAVVLEKELGL